MSQILDLILSLEWELFDQVRNIGVRANCQDDRTTFFLMRSSQLSAWSEEMRRSYLDDLYLARAEGRNPLAEKYGYMMEYTDPAGYARIKDSLPPRSPEKLALIARICTAHSEWNRVMHERYPHLSGRGRAVDKSSDSLNTTSFDTYLAGELATYSLETLTFYWTHVSELQTRGENMNELILKNTVTQYGYPSLSAAETAIAGT